MPLTAAHMRTKVSVHPAWVCASVSRSVHPPVGALCGKTQPRHPRSAWLMCCCIYSFLFGFKTQCQTHSADLICGSLWDRNPQLLQTLSSSGPACAMPWTSPTLSNHKPDCGLIHPRGGNPKSSRANVQETHPKIGIMPVAPEHSQVCVLKLSPVRHPKEEPKLQVLDEELEMHGLLGIADVPGELKQPLRIEGHLVGKITPTGRRALQGHHQDD